jgi:ankyrin repeat protein
LYASAGLNNPALARALLEAGARLDDSESLYHFTGHADLTCLRLLLEYGASPRGGLNHMLDYENIDGVRLMLPAGADPNQLNQRGETALHWAVWRGRSAPIIAELLGAGFNMDARRKDGRTGLCAGRANWPNRNGDTVGTRRWFGCCLPPAPALPYRYK